MTRYLLMATSIFVLLLSSVSAGPVQDIKWEDQVPEAGELDDPFSHLKTDQLYDLESLADFRRLQAQRQSVIESDYRDEIDEVEKRLRKDGLDVEGLLKQYWSYLKEIRRRDKLVVADLDGKTVRLPGYALPLEMADTGVTEFFLVPYIGACIHVPPPPPNQMVLVHVEKPFPTEDMYVPVWVTGRITTQSESKKLSLVDGENLIETGYTIEATGVAAYEED